MLEQFQVCLLPSIASSEKVVSSEQNQSHSNSFQLFFRDGLFESELQDIEALFDSLRFEEEIGHVHGDDVAVRVF